MQSRNKGRKNSANFKVIIDAECNYQYYLNEFNQYLKYSTMRAREKRNWLFPLREYSDIKS